MEATSTAAVINNNLISIVLNFNLNVAINLFIYFAVATAGATSVYKLLTLGFEQLLKILEYKWIARYKDRKTLVVEVIKICNEASTSSWGAKPRDIEHVYFISRLLERQDKKARDLFDELVGSWQLNAIYEGKPNPSKEDTAFCIQLQNRAQEATEKLMGIVNKWK